MVSHLSYLRVIDNKQFTYKVSIISGAIQG